MDGDDSHVRGDKNNLLSRLITDGQPGSPLHEQQKMGIIVRCTEDIEQSLNSFRNTMAKNATASEKLAGRVLWLNLVLGGITAIGVIFTGAQFLKCIKGW